MPTLSIHGQSVYYTYKRGPEGAPALLLIHGAAGTHLDWSPQLRRLPQAHVYAVDLPGHGRSGLPGRERIGEYAAGLQALIAALGLHTVVLAGHSMGAAIAIELALQQPRWLRGLLLVGSGAEMPVNPRLLAQAREDFPATLDFLARHFWGPGAPEELVEAGRSQLARVEVDVLVGDFLACHRFDRRDDVDRIAVPALLITGTADRMMPLRHAEFLATAIPQTKLLAPEGAGHMVVLERPTAVAAAAAEFIESLAASENT